MQTNVLIPLEKDQKLRPQLGVIMHLKGAKKIICGNISNYNALNVTLNACSCHKLQVSANIVTIDSIECYNSSIATS